MIDNIISNNETEEGFTTPPSHLKEKFVPIIIPKNSFLFLRRPRVISRKLFWSDSRQEKKRLFRRTGCGMMTRKKKICEKTY